VVSHVFEPSPPLKHLYHIPTGVSHPVHATGILTMNIKKINPSATPIVKIECSIDCNCTILLCEYVLFKWKKTFFTAFLQKAVAMKNLFL
jgi:hypothetical protein